MKRTKLGDTLLHTLSTAAGLFAGACSADDCPVGDTVTAASGEPACLVYSDADDDRPCSSRGDDECERGGTCILDRVCVPAACSAAYCGACELRTACVEYE